MSFPPHSNLLFLDPFSAEAVSRDGVVTGGNNSNAYFVGSHMLSGGTLYSPPGGTMMMVDAQQGGSGLLAPVHSGMLMGGGGAADGDRNQSPSSTHSASSFDYAQKRAVHNAIERARRESLNGQFQDLASAVPALIHVKRPSKAVIVEKSLEYIRSFRDHLAHRDQCIRKLQVRNLALHDQVNHLRKQLGMEPISETAEVFAAAAPVLPLVGEAAGCVKEEGNEEEDNEEEEEDEEESAGDEDKPKKMKLDAAHRQSVGSSPLQTSPQALAPGQQQQHKRRQQSLDLGASRAPLRMATGRHAGAGAKAPGPCGSSPGALAGIHTTAAAGPGSSHVMYSHPAFAPQAAMTAAGAYAHHPSAAAAVAAAAAFVAHTSAAHQQQQQQAAFSAMSAAHFSSVMALGAAHAQSSPPALQVSPVGFMSHHSPAASLGIIDMSKLPPNIFASTPLAQGPVHGQPGP
ncbi:hypothetical protein GGI04_001028 [Coemansia thaxteri]|uniref:BHLH domain-containing protein n=1 Tax=Coemansia thaxteri TaxID=2663907 RepID=A0A9W8EMF9_9FUNG|nr:hypothetical protein H4R26_000074 [Coemansia thaxteri]KAJ2008754.1 hypothetical protein GGI04_001028 [Coemansia thaxteri]KAJ2472229.1 hypothetical protein GGI02_001733 [Coemansia sp. RSA 2322]KAJ2488153.1 hypothetical protein EV174_000118 [Coemansia sp. RSA 2320]